MILFNRQVVQHKTIRTLRLWLLPGNRACCTTQSREPKGFLLSEFRLLIDKTMHHVTVAVEKSDAPTNKPARELADGISRTEQNGDVATSPTKRALWKLKSDLMGAAVERWLKSGISPAWLVLWSN